MDGERRETEIRCPLCGSGQVAFCGLGLTLRCEACGHTFRWTAAEKPEERDT